MAISELSLFSSFILPSSSLLTCIISMLTQHTALLHLSSRSAFSFFVFKFCCWHGYCVTQFFLLCNFGSIYGYPYRSVFPLLFLQSSENKLQRSLNKKTLNTNKETYLNVLRPYHLCALLKTAQALYFIKRRNSSLINLISAEIWHLCKHKGPDDEYMTFCKAVSMKRGL